MKRFSLAVALLSAPLFASSTTSLEAPRHAADLFLTGSHFQVENPGPHASWLVFSDSRGNVLTATRVPSGSGLNADVPPSLLHEVRVEVLTPTDRGLYRGERTPLTLLPPVPTPDPISMGGVDPSFVHEGGGAPLEYAVHGGGIGVQSGSTPPANDTPPSPPL